VPWLALPAVTKLCDPLDTLPRPVVIALCAVVELVAARLPPLPAAPLLPAVTSPPVPPDALPRPVVASVRVEPVAVI